MVQIYKNISIKFGIVQIYGIPLCRKGDKAYQKYKTLFIIVNKVV
jgi:hypothetical protein